MSHACCLVAVDGKLRTEKEVLGKVTELMAPFSEEGEWFGNGSRWDYWLVGGRYNGRLVTKPGTEKIVGKESISCPHDGGPTCDGARISDLDHEAMIQERTKNWLENVERMREEKSKGMDAKMCKIVYGWSPDITDEKVIEEARSKPTLSAYAVLQEKDGVPEWHENERLGWFGGRAKIENQKSKTKKHVLQMKKDGKIRARIVNHQVKEEKWKAKVQELVGKLPPDSWIVFCDYHV